MKKALISGATGMDASYLAELLLEKQYEVYAITRRSSTNTTDRIAHLLDIPNYHLVEGDITDSGSIFKIISDLKPDECYNLAAQSHVGTSFDQPFYTFQVNAVGCLNFLEGIRLLSPQTRFYNASTSEMLGNNVDEDEEGNKYQDEFTEFAPRSPYSVSKLAAHNLVFTYRESYGLHASCGILHNHTGPRRGENFVERKITKWLGKFKEWLDELELTEDWLFKSESPDIIFNDTLSYPKLRLGNIESYRDWSHSKDMVGAMWLMLQQDEPDDYVVSSDIAHSVRELLQEAFNYAGFSSYEPFIYIDPKFYRPAEVDYLCGRSTKIRNKLGWIPKYSFTDIIHEMVEADINEAKNH
jgi:GDPmannose 4,6-dehydratase